MGMETKTGWTGLLTNTGELTAPAGALAQAENVVIRRAGVIEQRPGTIDHLSLSLSGDSAQKIIPYSAATVIAYLSGSTGKWWNASGDAALQHPQLNGTTVDPQFFRADLIPHAYARGNCYIGYRDGVLKYNHSVAWFEASGLIPTGYSYTAAVSATTPVWLTTASQVCYRFVARKTDANGVIIRSRPTGALLVQNTSGVTKSVSMNIACYTVYSGYVFDYVEIYRTRTFSTSVTPDEEYQLVGTVAAGASVAFTDTVADSARGATLYTSASRDGAQGANERPPACGAMALFRGSLFFGNTVGPKRRVASFNDQGASVSGSSGIGMRSITVDATTGSPTLINASSTTGLQKGMIVRNSTVATARTYITNISGTTITLSGNSLVTTVGVAITFEDAISVNGTWCGVSELTSQLSALNLNLFQGDAFVYSQTPAEGGYTDTLVIESYLRGTSAAIAINATHGNEYNPPLPLYGATADAGDQDTYPNGIMWSKTDEPEHVAPVNYAFVGDKASAILALAATKDALWILKEEGIWRLTGYNGQWRIDPVDPTTRCILPSSVQVMNNKVFALTNRGFVTIDESGVKIISLPIANTLKSMVYTLTRQGGPYRVTRTGDYMGQASACCNERDFEYVFLLGNMASQLVSGDAGALVYNDTTNAWTVWKWNDSASTTVFRIRPSIVAYSPKESAVLLGQYGTPSVTKSMASPTQTFGTSRDYACDGTQAVTVASSNATTFSTVYSPTTTLDTDCVLVDTSGDGTVYTISSVTNTTTVVLNAQCATGSALVAYPVVCKVQPRSFTDADESMKLWTHVAASFSKLSGPYSVKYGVKSSEILAASFADAPFDISAVLGASAYDLGCRLRGDVTDQAARGWRFDCNLTAKMVYGSMALEAISSEYREGRPNRPNLEVSSS